MKDDAKPDQTGNFIPGFDLDAMRLPQNYGGVRVCAPVHDAILIEAPLDVLPDVVAHTQSIMRQASAAVLGGFELRSDAKIIHSPDRYMDEHGVTMWNTVMGELGLADRQVAV